MKKYTENPDREYPRNIPQGKASTFTDFDETERCHRLLIVTNPESKRKHMSRAYDINGKLMALFNALPVTVHEN